MSSTLHAEIHKRVVFESGKEGYNIFRIPTMVKAANGDILAFAEARSGGDASEIDVVMKRSTDNGDTWGPLQVVIENDHYRGWDGLPTENVTAGNQSPVVDLLDPQHPGRIWMPFTLENDRVFVTYSDDHGKTWQADSDGRAREITAAVKPAGWGWYATGPVHGIQLERGTHAGRLVIPSDHTISGDWGAHVVYSDDHGETWALGAVYDETSGVIKPNENVAVELVDGSLYFNSRDNGTAPGTRSIAYSRDGGLTYDGPFVAEPQLSSPVVQNAVVRFQATDEGDDQNILLHSAPSNPTSRNDMTISVSFDEGTTWEKSTLIHPGPSAYSDLVKIDSQQFGVLWEGGDSLYQEILFGAMSFDDLDPVAFNGVEGDVNQDGIVDAQDLEAFVASWAPNSDRYFLGGADSYINGDLNFDGTQNLHDAVLLRSYLHDAGVATAGLQPLFHPVSEPGSLPLGVAGALSLVHFSRAHQHNRSSETSFITNMFTTRYSLP
ncbi:exo-alpha-sialidase [Aeoliella mucimassa]|nr:exo-alpha-sialidase [Aeoliella mucimassa]